MKYILDVDASKVIEAVRSTGVTITPAMMHYAHYLISNMKAIGTWSLCSAVYGFVGGTAGSHKFNWKDTRDLDAAFRLVFNGTVTHSSNGMQGDGSTGYADTKFNPSLYASLNSHHISIYVGNNVGTYSYDMGCYDGTYENMIISRYGNDLAYQSINTNSAFVTAPNTDSRGYFMANRTASNSSALYKNGIILANPATPASTSVPNFNYGIMCTNRAIPGGFTTRRMQLVTIGAGLTDTQAIQQSQIVTNAQNILNRA